VTPIQGVAGSWGTASGTKRRRERHQHIGQIERVVPSEWSVFGIDGAWLYDVTMPAQFEPMDIGEDYVAGRLIREGRELAVVFGLMRTTR